MPQDDSTSQLVNTLKTIRKIPYNATKFVADTFHVPMPTSDDNAPTQSKSDIDAENKYMDAAGADQAAKLHPKTAPKAAPKAATPPKYHKGTDYVPKTGPAVLKKGEAVLNTKDAAEYRKEKGKTMASTMEHAAHALGGHKEEKPKKEVEEMHIRRSKNGGHIIKHKHTRPEHHPDEEHTTKGDDELAEHVMTHMGDMNDGEADANAGNSGIPSEAESPAAGAGAAPPPTPGAGASPMPGM